MILNLWFSLIVFLFCVPSYAQENISDFSDKSVPVLNDELRNINGKLRQLNGGLAISSTTGILTTSRGGTGQNFGSATPDTLAYFDTTGTMVLTSTSAGDTTKFLRGDFSFATVVAPPDYIAGDVLLNSLDTSRNITVTATSYALIKEIQIVRGGALRIKFDLTKSGGGGGSLVYAKIYRNGVDVGTERSELVGPTTFSEDISGWSRGDLCQVYGKTDGVADGALSNFRIYATIPTKETGLTDTAI